MQGGGLEPRAGAAAPARRSMSGIPNVCLDHRVAGDLRRRDSVAAILDVEDLARPDQSYRRCLTSLLEPCSVELELRPVEVTGAEADVCKRDPCRCERRMCDTPPFSRSSRMRTGGVEPPQPGATRLQRAELADARRPQGIEVLRRRKPTPSGIAPPKAGSRGSVPLPRNPPSRKKRAAGRARTDTAGPTTPDACRYTTAAMDLGEPMVPPRAPPLGSYRSPEPGLPGGEAALRPRSPQHGQPVKPSAAW